MPLYLVLDLHQYQKSSFEDAKHKTHHSYHPGAWHHPPYYLTLVSLLEKKGYNVVCPHPLTCNNDETPTKTFADNVALSRTTASKLADEGHEINAFMHSYGGIVETDALYGLPATERAKAGLRCGLKRLLYMCAFTPQNGQSLAGIFGGGMPPYIVEDQDGQFLDVEGPEQRLYHNTADPSHGAQQLLKHPNAAPFTAMSHEAFREVPVTYLLCEKDHALPVEVQKMMIGLIEQAGVRVETVESCDESHSPFLSMPEKVIEIVVTAAEAG